MPCVGALQNTGFGQEGETRTYIKEGIAGKTGERQCKNNVLEANKEESISRKKVHRSVSSGSNADYGSIKMNTQTWPSDLVTWRSPWFMIKAVWVKGWGKKMLDFRVDSGKKSEQNCRQKNTNKKER